MAKKTFLTLGLMSIVTSGLVAGVVFDYSGTGGFDNNYSIGGAVGGADGGATPIADTFDYNHTIDTSLVGAPIEYNPQKRPATPSALGTGTLYPMIDWGENHANDKTVPPIDGKSALGLVPYASNLPESNPFVAQVEADSGNLVPAGAITHYNVHVKQWGLIRALVEWELKISKDGNELWKESLPFPFAEWETYNSASNANEPKTYDPVNTIVPAGHCPREFTGLMTDPWSVEPLEWKGDTMNMTVCDDAARYQGGGDPQVVGTFLYPPVTGQNYAVVLSGFYDCNDDNGIYHPLTECTQEHTFWGPEAQNNTAYVMLSVKALRTEGCTPGYYKNESNVQDLGHNWPIDPVTSNQFKVTDTVQYAFGLNGDSGKTVCLQKTCTPAERTPIGDVTLAQALALKGGDVKALTRHATAGLFNVYHGMNYWATDAQIVKNYYACAIGDSAGTNCPAASIEEIKDLFGDANEDGECTIDQQWEPQEITTRAKPTSKKLVKAKAISNGVRKN